MLEFALLRGGGTFYQLGLEDVVRIVGWQAEKEVSDLCGELRTKGTDDVLELRLLRGYSVSGELGLDLGEPDFGIDGSEGWQLDAEGSDGCGGVVGSRSGRSFGGAFFERHHEGGVNGFKVGTSGVTKCRIHGLLSYSCSTTVNKDCVWLT